MKVRIGLMGAGHLGKIHLKILREMPQVELTGFYDADPQAAAAVSAAFGVRAFQNETELIKASEAVDIVTPTLAHYACARLALEAGRHIFVEKPLTHTVEEASELIAIAETSGVKAQVGHVERFNPAFMALEGRPLEPMFIEGHRLAQYNPRGTDVSVVLDLMIHDLDLVLSMVKSPIRSISASGVAIVSRSPDIANARIEFDNGCVANLTASRISMKNMRRLRLFQPDGYMAVDFLQKQTESVRLFDQLPESLPKGAMHFDIDTGEGKKFLVFELLAAPAVNSIQLELEAFVQAIIQDTPTPVGLDDGYAALVTAYKIHDQIEQRLAGTFLA